MLVRFLICAGFAVWAAFLVRPLLAEGLPGEVAVDSFEDGAEPNSPASSRWNARMDPVAPIAILAGRGVAAAGAGSSGIACPGGGTVVTSCREDGGGTLLSTTVTGCRLLDEQGRILSVSGELLIASHLPGGCATGILPECGQVSVRAANYVATIADANGTVLDTLSLHDHTTVLHEVVLPCDARAAR